jgi:hypothetical protein
MTGNSGVAELEVIEVSAAPLAVRQKQADRVKAWKLAHPEKRREYYANANPRTCAEPDCNVDITSTGMQRCFPHAEARAAELDRQRCKSEPTAHRLWRAARGRASGTSLPFELQVEDIAIPERCPVFGERLVTGRETSGPWSPTLDRVIPELGYVRGNVWVISLRANVLKRNYSLDELADRDDELGAWARGYLIEHPEAADLDTYLRAHPNALVGTRDNSFVVGEETEVDEVEVIPAPPQKRAGSSSAYWGVSWDRSRSKWMASAVGATVGRFDNEEDAARARDAKIIELGLDAPLNFGSE